MSMISYNKTYLDTLAHERGFLRDNLEKVLRLVKILNFMNQNQLLSKSLVLKGGTAINLTIFELPRLSVDIDLDYNMNIGRDEMLNERGNVNSLIFRYMTSEGYSLKPTSKSPHSLDSWVFGYTNAGNNLDNIKIEINYSARCHVLPTLKKAITIDFLGDVKVNVLDPVELFASKINALVNRGAMRDIYDVSTMIVKGLFHNKREMDLLRKIFVFYRAVGSTSSAENVNLHLSSFPMIEAITYSQVRSQLMPVLRRGDKFDYVEAKNRILSFMRELVKFSEEELAFIQLFNKREYKPEVLFGSGEISNRIINHPMALWKCRPANK